MQVPKTSRLEEMQTFRVGRRQEEKGTNDPVLIVVTFNDSVMDFLNNILKFIYVTVIFRRYSFSKIILKSLLLLFSLSYPIHHNPSCQSSFGQEMLSELVRGWDNSFENAGVTSGDAFLHKRCARSKFT